MAQGPSIYITRLYKLWPSQTVKPILNHPSKEYYFGKPFLHTQQTRRLLHGFLHHEYAGNPAEQQLRLELVLNLLQATSVIDRFLLVDKSRGCTRRNH